MLTTIVTSEMKKVGIQTLQELARTVAQQQNM